MKKPYIPSVSGILAAISFLLVSCRSEIDLPVAGLQGDVVIKAVTESSASTRTKLNQSLNVVWCEGDEFALLDRGGSRDRFTLNDGVGQASGSFSGKVSGTAPFCAFYPYSEECTNDGGKLKFKLPEVQMFAANSFGNGASPAVATLADASSPAQFRNICGALELQFRGSGLKFSKIVVTDLSGAPLWGDCELLLDGKQGTDEQTLRISGGSNEITLDCGKEISLLKVTTKDFTIIVPPGSFSKGFTVKLFDKDGKAVSFMTATDAGVSAVRSFITQMKPASIPDNGEPVDTLARGYYKDIFQNSGCGLTTYLTLPAATYLGMTLETMATSVASSSSYNSADSVFQHNLLCGTAEDLNGVLLYPDGEPRYRMIYVNGGNAMTHSKSLRQEGRDAIINFVHAGGSYIGSCAGAFFACHYKLMGSSPSSYTVDDYSPYYIGLWPGVVRNTNLSSNYTGCVIEPGSPLLKYFDFGGDMFVDSLRHNGGCYGITDRLWPANGEVLARFDISKVKPKPSRDFHMAPVIWSVKEKGEWGRVISCGSHPEQVADGELRDLMAAMILYACEGNGSVSVKGTLSNGITRDMKESSAAGNPGNTRIGDKQYHHFKVDIPEGAKNVKVAVSGDGGNNLELAMRKGGLAWRSDAQYLLTQSGTDKELCFDSLEPGTWYISVYCRDFATVSYGCQKFTYSGNTAVLNGVPYSITVKWE